MGPTKLAPEATMTKEQIAALALLDTQVAELQSLFNSPHFVFAWPQHGLGVKTKSEDDTAHSVVRLALATPVSKYDDRRFSNGKNERAVVIALADAARTSATDLRALRNKLASVFGETE